MLNPFKHWLLDAPLRKFCCALCRCCKLSSTYWLLLNPPPLDNPSHSLYYLVHRTELGKNSTACCYCSMDPGWMLRTSYDVFLFVSSNFVFLIFLAFFFFSTYYLHFLSAHTSIFHRLYIDSNFHTHTPCFGWLLGKTFPQTGRSCETHKKNKITWTARNRDKYEIPITKMCRSENETKNPQLFPLICSFFFQVAYRSTPVYIYYYSFIFLSLLIRLYHELAHSHRSTCAIHEHIHAHRRAEAPESVDFEFKKNSHSP